METKFDANEIIKNLYLGDYHSSINVNELKQRGITHILSIGSGFEATHSQDFKYQLVSLLDVASANIIIHFPATYDFIEEALSSHGSILIHCMAGVSRSATVTLAYLMKKMNLTFYEAVTVVTSSRSKIAPNMGFIQQLKLFESLGYDLNEPLPTAPLSIKSRFQEYKLLQQRFELDNLCSQWKETGVLEAESLQTLPDSIENCRENVITCLSCKRPLFYEKSIVHHKRNQCKYYIILPTLWMKDELDQVSGPLTCPQCKTSIGTFAWLGEEKCSCTFTISPAFKIYCSKTHLKRIKM